MKSRKDKMIEYDCKYGHIPHDYVERLHYLCDTLRIDNAKAEEIINARNAFIASTYYETIKIVLYEVPEFSPRPRARLVTKKGLINAVTGNNTFVRIYSISGKENKDYMRMYTKQHLEHLEQLLCTPCDIEYHTYFPTPVSYNKIDVFLAEIGIHRPMSKPDFDNIEKAYSDSFTGNIWIDDIVVVDATLRKFYSVLPRVEIYLKYANQISNAQQYRNIIRRKDFTQDMSVTYFGGESYDDKENI
jgi:Holliday junction resolvase RusA-like endonuclease